MVHVSSSRKEIKFESLLMRRQLNPSAVVFIKYVRVDRNPQHIEIGMIHEYFFNKKLKRT